MSKSGLVVKDFGRDGNAYALMGQVTNALRRGGRSDLVEPFRKEATSGDYDHLVQTCLEYVDVDEASEEEN